MVRKIAVVLVIVSSVGLLVTLGNANAQVVDPAVKACLEKSIGLKAAKRIVAAKKLTKAQTAQVARCKSTSGSGGGTSDSTSGSTNSTGTSATGMVSLNYGLLAYIGSQQAGLGNIADPALLQVGGTLRMFFKNGNEPQIPIAGFDNKIHSYISTDNGKTWTLESGVRIDVTSPVTVRAAESGGYEAWGWVSSGGDAMTRFTSATGSDFIKGAGNVINASACKSADGVAAGFLGDPQVVKVASGYLAYAHDLAATGKAPFKRHMCALTSTDGSTWVLDTSKTLALQSDIQTNPETYRNSSGVIEQILAIDQVDPTTKLRSGMQLRTSTNDGVSWTELSELSFFAADPDRLDLSNGDSLLAFGGFDQQKGGLLGVAKKISTAYKASRTESDMQTVVWTISGASQADIKIKNLCLNSDLTASIKFATSGSNITATYTAAVGGHGNSCVYALIGSEQAIK
jgi:hypothetical protein